jgi:hypothetical protein
MGYDCEARHLDSGDPGYARNLAIDGPDGVEKLRLVARASENRLARHTPHPEEMRIFLVACHQASVSIKTMSTYLGLDADIIRTELLLGIAAWNAARRRTNDTAFKPGLRLTASGD